MNDKASRGAERKGCKVKFVPAPNVIWRHHEAKLSGFALKSHEKEVPANYSTSMQRKIITLHQHTEKPYSNTLFGLTKISLTIKILLIDKM